MTDAARSERKTQNRVINLVTEKARPIGWVTRAATAGANHLGLTGTVDAGGSAHPQRTTLCAHLRQQPAGALRRHRSGATDQVVLLQGGTLAWMEAGLPLEQGETGLASPRTDRYRRPYEGTDNPREAMPGYLD